MHGFNMSKLANPVQVTLQNSRMILKYSYRQVSAIIVDPDQAAFSGVV